jgi:hypothetical protein
MTRPTNNSSGANTSNHRGIGPDSSSQGPQAHQQHAAAMPGRY